MSGVEKATLFRDADVVAIPSIVTRRGDAEGIPVVLLEALAAGKLTVATNVSGAAEVLRPGEDGFLVPQKDAAALAAGIAHALQLPEDERHAVTERARRTARAYDWDVIARAHVQHLFPLP